MYIKTYQEYNEGIRKNIAKAGLIGSLLIPSTNINSRESDSLSKKVNTEYFNSDKFDIAHKNINEISNIRKHEKVKDVKLSKLLSDIELNLSNDDSTKFVELFDSLSNHLEAKYGYKIENKKIENLNKQELENKDMTIFSVLGWLGSICLAICGIPQAWLSYKEKNSKGISWAFLLLWTFGEIFALAYVYDKLDLPLLLNYSINILILTIILYYKINPGKEKSIT